ncbi:MAG TPA: hypothetical protein VFJ16_02330 [Longimicrobium sp.]|nr:hypothetical protein [Longimicrobium sp.]
MKKLSLELDALTVESFTTGDAVDGRGTVRGRDTLPTEFCNTKSCNYTRCCATGADDEAPPAPARAE